MATARLTGQVGGGHKTREGAQRKLEQQRPGFSAGHCLRIVEYGGRFFVIAEAA